VNSISDALPAEAGLVTRRKSGISPAELSAVVFSDWRALCARRKTTAAITIPAAPTTMTNSS